MPKACDDGQGAGIENTMGYFSQGKAKHEKKRNVSEDQFCFAYVSGELERTEVENETVWLPKYLRKYKIYCFLTYTFGKMCFCEQIETFLLLLVKAVKCIPSCCHDKSAE